MTCRIDPLIWPCGDVAQTSAVYVIVFAADASVRAGPLLLRMRALLRRRGWWNRF